MGKTAIVLGATGLVGGHLLRLLLDDNDYSVVKVFGRSSVGISEEKLEEYIVDLLTLEKHSEKFTGDVVFCCVGTTKAKTSDKSHYRDIDYGIPVTAATLSEEKNIKTFIVVSALGADKNSRVFYNRVKGDMEEAVMVKNIEEIYIMQPSLIGGERDESRMGESIAKFFMNLLQPLMVGDLRKYRPIHPNDIAKAMMYLAGDAVMRETKRIESDHIKELAKQYD